jgi:DNA helicase II / ATP-dependent DNA helicase PcrA
MNYLNQLNGPQRDAVVCVDKPVLVVAGAGSGKTRCITYKTIHLLENGLQPHNILLLTFTKKAAQEMLQRVKELSGKDVTNIAGGTFHSFALDIVRRFSPIRQQVIDEGEVRSFFRVKVKEYELEKVLDAAEAIQLFSKAANTQKPLSELFDKPQKDMSKVICKLHDDYKEFKSKQNLLDFDDILLLFNKLLSSDVSLRARVSGLFNYILVDEYQDTNILQSTMLEQLTSHHHNITVVGDYAQSIYGFRGANPENINGFLDRFPNAQIIKLNQNYRSHENIIDVVNNFYEKLELGKLANPLWSDRSSKLKPTLVMKQNQYQVNDFILSRLGQFKPGETAVLYRSGYDARHLEYTLVEAGIPYNKYGGMEIKEAKHVKDFISYLRIILNPNDLGSWKRVLGLVKGVGKATIEKILQQIQQRGVSGLHAKGKIMQELQKLYFLFSQDPNNVPEVINSFTAYYMHILDSRKDLKTEAEYYENRVADIALLSERWKASTSLQSIVDAWYTEDIFDDSPEKNEKLTLSTVHSAKGLEWDNVFMINLTEGRFPSGRSMELEEDMKEEHRLFYVAMTRARENLFLCCPRAYIEGRDAKFVSPSRFLSGLKLVRL